jgi:hypothetical protein
MSNAYPTTVQAPSGLTVRRRELKSRLLKTSTTEELVATVNFSVPDDVKQAFDKAFSGRNKSAIVAELMRHAVRESKRRQRREQLFKLLTSGRAQRPAASDAALRGARKASRE